MKRFLQILTIALAIPMVSIAQNSVTITGTVSNNDGVVPNTLVTLSTPSTPAFPGEIIAEANTDEVGFYIFQEDLEENYPVLELSTATCNYFTYLDSMIYPYQGNIDIDCSTGSGGNDCEALFVFVPDSIIDGAIYYINASTGTDLEYFWDFGDGTESTEPYPTHTYDDAEAEYNVCLTISNNDCEDTYCTTVSGSYDGSPTGSGLLGDGNQSQQGEGIGSGFIFIVQSNIVSGVQENLQEVDFNIYPNPSKGLVNINLDVQESGNIVIVDLSGKIVFEANNVNVQNSELALNSLNDGVYIIQFRSVNYISTSKLVLQR